MTPTGHGRNERDPAWPRLKIGQCFEQLVFDRIHLVCVKRIIDSQLSHESAFCFKFRGDRFQRLRVASECNQIGTVDRGQLDLVREFTDHFAHLRRFEARRDHPPVTCGRVL